MTASITVVLADDQFHQKFMSRNVKTAVMSNPVDDTKYIKNSSLLEIIN